MILMKGLYVHVPFCLQKCHYCDFVITTKRSGKDREDFFRAFEKELRQTVSKYGRLNFETLYLGGGTPSALEGGEMERLAALLRSEFDFKLGFEFTCEVNPGDVDAQKLESYRRAGINRISLGVQAFQDPLLKDMGRPHTVKDIDETLQALRSLGFENISFDLIAGLPKQTLGDYKKSLEKLIELGASQLSLYDLDVHEPTVYGMRRRRGQLPVPEEETRAQMYELTCALLPASGYRHYEISTFAKPGYESKHNQLYWRNREYLGLGPGAFSYLNGVRYQFASDMRRYLKKCAEGIWEPDVEDRLSEEEKETETLFTGLRLIEGVDLGQFQIIRKKTEDRLEKAGPYQWFKRQENKISLSPKGRFFVEKAIGLLIEK